MQDCTKMLHKTFLLLPLLFAPPLPMYGAAADKEMCVCVCLYKPLSKSCVYVPLTQQDCKYQVSYCKFL